MHSASNLFSYDFNLFTFVASNVVINALFFSQWSMQRVPEAKMIKNAWPSTRQVQNVLPRASWMSLWPFSPRTPLLRHAQGWWKSPCHPCSPFQFQQRCNGVVNALFMVFLKGVRMKELQRQNWHVLAALESYSPPMTRIHGSSVVAVKIC
jgi:hypothetical protein